MCSRSDSSDAIVHLRPWSESMAQLPLDWPDYLLPLAHAILSIRVAQQKILFLSSQLASRAATKSYSSRLRLFAVDRAQSLPPRREDAKKKRITRRGGAGEGRWRSRKPS